MGGDWEIRLCLALTGGGFGAVADFCGVGDVPLLCGAVPRWKFLLMKETIRFFLIPRGGNRSVPWSESYFALLPTLRKGKWRQRGRKKRKRQKKKGEQKSPKQAVRCGAQRGAHLPLRVWIPLGTNGGELLPEQRSALQLYYSGKQRHSWAAPVRWTPLRAFCKREEKAVHRKLVIKLHSVSASW